MHFDFTGVILRHQRKKAEKVYRDLESLRKMAGKSNNLPGDGDSLQLSIYRKFEETECLLDQLKIQEDSPSIMSSEQSSDQTPVKNVERSFSAEPTNGNIRLPTDTRDIVVGVASKKPKDEVSEYISQKLKSLVKTLVFRPGQASVLFSLCDTVWTVEVS